MRTPSGDLHVVDFKTSQIVSAIQPKDYWDDKRHWEIKNNIDTLEFRVFENTDHAATLVQQNLVLKEVRGGRIVPYVITEAEKNSDDKSLIVYASGEWIQLAKAGIIEPQKIESKTLKQCMEIALKGTKWEIGKTEHDGAHSMVIEEFIDPLNLLKKISASFELEIQYRAEVVGSQIVARYVDMVKKRGRDTRKEITLGKDLMGIKRIENSQNICTALLGYVTKDNGEFITISEINNGVPYLVDDAAYQRWNEKGKHKFAFYTPQTENQDMSPQRLMILMKTEMNKLVNTSVSYEVQAQSIGQVFGLAHELINEGDTIRIIDTGFTPKLYLEARAIAADESFKDPSQDKYVFGDYREIVDQNDELRRLYQKILSSLYDKVPQDLFDDLANRVDNTELTSEEAKKRAEQAEKESKVAKDLAEATQDYMEKNLVDIIESVKPPTTDLKANKTLWRDISNGKPGILKIWTGTAWESVVPDVESVKKETLEQVTKDINNTKQELDKKVETLKTETETLVNTQIKEVQATLNDKVAAVKKDTETISGEILNIKKDVSGKVDGEFVKNQIKDKADKSGVFTKEEINNGFIGKQIYETDKQGNVKKFQEINTSVEQTNEAIKSKAEKQSVIDLGNNITQVSKTANEAKQTADGNTRTISQVDSKVNQTATDFTKKTTAIEETVNGVSTKVTNIQSEQGKISERVTKSEQTADGFKTSIESLTRKDSEISNKLNTVESTVEGTKKTISNIQSDTTSLKQTTTEIKEQAGKVTEKLSSVEKKFDDMKIGGRNIILNTAGTLKSDTGAGVSNSVNKTFKIVPDGLSMLQGQQFTISFKARTIAYEKGTPNPWAGVEVWVKYKDGEQVWPGVRCENNVFANQEWKTYSFTHTLKDKTIEVFQPQTLLRNVKGMIELKEWQIEIGNKATDYKPAAEDQVTTDEFTKKTTDIEKSVDGVKTTVTSVQNSQAGFDKRMSTVEQTADGFKTSIESLTKKDSEISNKLNTVESTVEGTKKTISDVQQKTNDLKKTTTEITEKAGKISEKLESVEKKFDEQEIGVRNLISDTKYWETTQLASNSAYGIFKNNLNSLFSTLVGQTVTFSFDVKLVTNNNTEGRVQFYGSNGSPKYTFAQKVFTGITKDFQRVTYTTKITEIPSNTGQARLEFWGIDAKTTKIIIQNFKLEKGNKATGWTPAPEEQVTTDEFTKKTTDIEKSVDGVKTTITNVQNSQAGFEKRVNTVEQTVDKNSQTITTLSTTQGKQGELIQSNKSSIEQLNNKIKLTVSETQMEDYIGSLGTTNLFLNTTFETKELDKDGNVTKRTPSLDKWSFTSNTKPGVITEASVSRHHAGYNSLHIQSTGQTSNVYVNAFQDAPMLSNSGAYVLSFWMYTENVNSIDEGATVGMYIYGGGSQVGKKELALKPLLKSGAWVFIVVNVDALTVPTTHARMYLTLVKNGSIYLSQPQYQQGTKPSTYMPNPKDITNYKEMIDLVGSKVATSDYNKQVTKYDTQFEQNTREINLRATKESVYTKTEGDNKYGEKAMVVRHEAEIKTQANEISLRVKAGDIASRINQTAQSVLIQAQKINLVGAVTAESINSGILRGTQIYTNADTSGNYLKLEKQNLTLMKGTQARGYFGFIDRTDAGIQSALVLGNDYSVNKTLEGSLVIDHVVQGTGWTNSQASIGIASGGKTGNEINMSSYIKFERYMDKLNVRSKGPIEIKTDDGNVNISAQANAGRGGTLTLKSVSDTYLECRGGNYYFKTSDRMLAGEWSFLLRDTNPKNGGDADFNLGNQITLRAARQYPYTMEGLQVKNNKGNDYASISCATVIYSSLSQRSTRKIKTAIKDIEAINPLDKLMELTPRQYYMKVDVSKLYEKRQEIINSGSGERMPTYDDIPHQYGFIAEEVPEEFATPHCKAVNMYPLITMGIAGTQEVYKKHLSLEETVKTQAEKLEVQAVMIQAQDDRIARLEGLLLQQLINMKQEQS
ncbi:phage tail spike protein [Bacillus mycoides]|uniref:phage tail spike protein n=1 Tax=Bacillus mycoides TaxID=1405 RepID=UPI003D1FFAEB